MVSKLFFVLLTKFNAYYLAYNDYSKFFVCLFVQLKKKQQREPFFISRMNFSATSIASTKIIPDCTTVFSTTSKV